MQRAYYLSHLLHSRAALRRRCKLKVELSDTEHNNRAGGFVQINKSRTNVEQIGITVDAMH